MTRLVAFRFMTRLVAFRACGLFSLLSVLFGALGAVSQASLALASFAVAGALCALTLAFAGLTSVGVAVPVRARRSRRHGPYRD
jgi:hypothetical protein